MFKGKHKIIPPGHNGAKRFLMKDTKIIFHNEIL